MFATGARKDSSDVLPADGVEKAAVEDAEPVTVSENQTDDTKQEEEEEGSVEDPRKVLKSLLAQAKSVIANPKGGKVGAKQKQNLRAFQKQIKRQLSRPESTTTLTDDLEAQFQELKNQLTRQPNLPPSHEEATSLSSPPQPQEETATTTPSTSSPTQSQTENSPPPQNPSTL